MCFHEGRGEYILINCCCCCFNAKSSALVIPGRSLRGQLIFKIYFIRDPFDLIGGRGWGVIREGMFCREFRDTVTFIIL